MQITTTTTSPPHSYSYSYSTTRFVGAFISSSPSTLSLSSFSYPQNNPLQLQTICAVQPDSQESYGPDYLRKPTVSPAQDNYEEEGERWVDWEDRILEDTAPLVGFVRMILHSDRYQSGDRLSPEHERTILDRLLPYHPGYESKVGCGIDYITVGYHPEFEGSRCLFIVRKDGELVDFSYWKCIKGLIQKNYPLYADTFILKHFRRRRRYD